MSEQTVKRPRGRPPTRGAHGDVRLRFECAGCGDATDGFADTVRHERLLCRTCYGKKADRRPKTLNALTGKEWASSSRSIETYPDTRSTKQREHGAAFPQSLARTHIEMYTKPGDVVLDPFVGVGTTLDAAVASGRRGIGIDINERFLELASADLPKGENIKLIKNDARRMSKFLPAASASMLLTSPPYSSLLKTIKGSFGYKWKEHSHIAAVQNPLPYSSDKQDIGNLDYDEFLDAITAVMLESTVVLKSRAYSVWVVKDFRNIKKGIPYVNLHGDVITCAESAGLQLWDIRIFDQTKFRPLVCLGFPSDNYYLNIGHSYILIFRNK